MPNTTKLNKAKMKKDDEYYTTLIDIDRELAYYKKYFFGAKIFLPCDSEKSNFWVFLNSVYYDWGIAEIVATHYESDKPSYGLRRIGDCVSSFPLRQDGDFRSGESKALMADSDIVITNPPFSLFRVFFDVLIDMNKKFLVVSPVHATTYSNVFHHIVNIKTWPGVNRLKEFFRPDGSMKGVTSIWLTNMAHGVHKTIKLSGATYYGNEDKYPKYDNYDAIEVGRIKDIPCDYDGVMGVPITFIADYEFPVIAEYDARICGDLLVDGKKKFFRYLIRGLAGYYKNLKIGGKGVFTRVMMQIENRDSIDTPESIDDEPTV